MTATEFRELLDGSGLTRAAAAKRLGVGTRTVYDWLTAGIPKPLMADAVRRALTDNAKAEGRGIPRPSPYDCSGGTQ